MLALAALAFVHFREPKWAPPARVQFDIGALDKVTLGPYLRLSPDGRRIAFVAMSNSRGTLWVHDTSTGDSRALTPAESLDTNNVSLLWSPDSRFIAFPHSKKLKKVEATGGPVQTICDLPDGNFNAGAWSQDDVILFGVMPLYIGCLRQEVRQLHYLQRMGRPYTPCPRFCRTAGISFIFGTRRVWKPVAHTSVLWMPNRTKQKNAC